MNLSPADYLTHKKKLSVKDKEEIARLPTLKDWINEDLKNTDREDDDYKTLIYILLKKKAEAATSTKTN